MIYTRFLLMFFVLYLWFPPAVCAAVEETTPPANEMRDELIRSQLRSLQTEEIETLWRQLQTEYGKYFSGGTPPSLLDALFSHSEKWSMKEVLLALAKYFFHEVLYNGELLGAIIVLTVFSILLQTLQTAFENNQVSKVAYAIVFMVIIVMAVQSFRVAVQAAEGAIHGMIDVMLALMPLLMTLLATMGNIGSVTLFHPLIIFMIHVIGTVIYTIIFPLLFFSTILSIVSSLSDPYKLNQLAGLMRKISVAGLGGLLTIFLGVISIQGATASVADGITIRTAKYITGNFVPVIGRTISEAADTVVGASLLVKNTVGLAGVIILLLVFVFPALKILSLAFIYNFSAAVMQPLGNSTVIESLSTIGRTLIYVFAALTTVGLMFFLAITIIVASGNISVMMR
jgi:stage III sporulation protein AE